MCNVYVKTFLLHYSDWRSVRQQSMMYVLVQGRIDRSQKLPLFFVQPNGGDKGGGVTVDGFSEPASHPRLVEARSTSSL